MKHSGRRCAQTGITIKGAILNGFQHKASMAINAAGAYGYYEYGPRT